MEPVMYEKVAALQEVQDRIGSCACDFLECPNRIMDDSVGGEWNL